MVPDTGGMDLKVEVHFFIAITSASCFRLSWKQKGGQNKKGCDSNVFGVTS